MDTKAKDAARASALALYDRANIILTEAERQTLKVTDSRIRRVE